MDALRAHGRGESDPLIHFADKSLVSLGGRLFDGYFEGMQPPPETSDD